MDSVTIKITGCSNCPYVRDVEGFTFKKCGHPDVIYEDCCVEEGLPPDHNCPLVGLESKRLAKLTTK